MLLTAFYYYYEDNYTNNGKYKVQARPFLLQMVMAVSCLPIFYNYFDEYVKSDNYYVMTKSFRIFSEIEMGKIVN